MGKPYGQLIVSAVVPGETGCSFLIAVKRLAAFRYKACQWNFGVELTSVTDGCRFEERLGRIFAWLANQSSDLRTVERALPGRRGPVSANRGRSRAHFYSSAPSSAHP